MKAKQLWMLVGGNGAGKTTFYEHTLKPLGMAFVNADIISKEAFPSDPEGNSLHAARLAEELRYNLLEQGYSFCFETVFSHPSKIDFIAAAKTKGYRITLVFIHLGNNPNLNHARITQRVAEGGHSVPPDKIASRIPRMLEQVYSAVPLCDEVWVLDNSSLAHPFRELLVIRDGFLERYEKNAPEWAAPILENYLSKGAG